MKAPGFWARPGGVARVLSPLESITKSLTARRVARPGFDPGIPVFCVGNAGVGGAGKTIVVRDLLRRLPGRPFALTRGHGGNRAGPVLVDTERQGAAQVGDEALLLAASGPTVLARDRAAGARLALAEGASAIVMDDGLQNPGLKKTCSLLVIDGGYGFGNGSLLPAGPLREPVAAAAARCRAAVLIGQDRTGSVAALPHDLPVLRADLVPACVISLAGIKVLAFAGIGRPQKFFESVRARGADVAGTGGFADHHHYTRKDSDALLARARKMGARLVTTEKDFVKLPRELAAEVILVTVGLRWEDEAALRAVLSV